MFGCDSDHAITFENRTKQPSTLKIIATTGEYLEVELAQDIDPKVLIAINTWIANHQIQETTLIQQQARQDNLAALKITMVTLCVIALAAVVILGEVIYLKGRKTHE